MTVLTAAKLRSTSVVGVLVCLQHLLTFSVASYELFFDKYGDCSRNQPFDLADDDYTLKPVGGWFAHETKVCEMTFKSPSEYGVCMKFDEFEIIDCNVRIKFYSSSTSSGMTWRVLECTDTKPSQMCTSSRYVTIQVFKEKLNHNKGYKFKIDVEKSNSITEEGVLFASIGVFVGVILGVVALTAILAISVIYCCCKHRTKKKSSETRQAGPHENQILVQPSAPPVDIDDHQWGESHEGQSFTHVGYYPPPPYAPPPPYQPEDTLREQDPGNDETQAYTVKP